MNEHARKIYQAALNDKTVQRFWRQYEHEWTDMDPFQCMDILQPHNRPEAWRIKPKYRFERRFSRAYFDKDVNAAAIYHKESADKIREFEKKDFFGGWLTDWLVYEVEVENE